MIEDVVTLLPLLTHLKMPRFFGTYGNCEIKCCSPSTHTHTREYTHKHLHTQSSTIIHTDRLIYLLHTDLFHSVNTTQTVKYTHSIHNPSHHIRDNLTVPMYHHINLCAHMMTGCYTTQYVIHVRISEILEGVENLGSRMYLVCAQNTTTFGTTIFQYSPEMLHDTAK